MIKRLFLMRHSVTEGFASSDFERNLTKRGISLAKNQAIKLETFLNENNIKLDYCFYSSANRTTQTFDTVNKIMNLNIKAHKTMALYLTGMKELKNLFKTYDKEIENKENILIVAHNFGISDIASLLTGSELYMDTADIIVLDINIVKTWFDLLDYEGNWDVIWKII